MLKRNDFDQKTLIIADRGFESYNFIIRPTITTTQTKEDKKNSPAGQRRV